MLAVIAGFSGLAADRPVVVVLAPFKYAGWDMRDMNWWRLITPFREQVAGELARNYNCVVLSRSFGHALSMEDAAKRLGAIDDAEFAPEYLAGADYSFTGMFVPGSKSVVLRMVDLRSASATWEDKVTSVNAPVFEGSAAQVAQEIAEAASIPKRASPRAVDSGRRVWMVLPPVVTAQALQGKRDETAAALQMVAEITLQKEEARVKLVDRMALEAVLKEHAIGGLRNEADLRKISRLVGAERALIVLASSTGQRDEVQVDVLALDVVRTEVLSAVMRRCGKDDMLKAIEESVAECVTALGVPSALASATPAQRAKEARLYIDTAKKNFERENDNIAALTVMEYAEMVYLLARDNREIMYDITHFIANKNESWGRQLRKDSILAKGEVSQFIRRVQGQYPDIGAKDNGSWAYYAAQSFASDKDYAAAKQIAENALKAKPKKALEETLRRVIAEYHYSNGDYRRALECIKGDDDGYTRLARVKITQALKDEDAEFAAMSKMSSGDYFFYSYYFECPEEWGGMDKNLWFRHLELLEKRKGPAAVCAFIEKNMNMYRPALESHIKYELAKYHMRAGDKKKAAEIAHALLDQGRWAEWQIKNVEFRKLLEEMVAQAGDAAEAPVWKKASELKEIPKAFAFYIQPVGEVRPQLLEAVRSGVEEFFGAKAILLPTFELSRDAPYYIKANNRYNARLLTEEVKRQMKLPSNALSAVMVMEEELFSPEAGISCWSYSYDWFTIITSVRTWTVPHDAKSQETSMRNLAIACISKSTFLVGYGDIPCITSRMQSSMEVSFAKFGYSPMVQPLYMKVDFAEKNRKMIELFRESGATIVEPPQGQ